MNCRRDAFDVYVGRPSPFGNPFSHRPGTLATYRVRTRDAAIARFEEWLMTDPELIARVRRELRGKVLGCWCAPDKACHAEILARVANED